MTVGSPTPMWLAAAPAEWPTPPERMSVSTLLQIESCARHWALGAASYPDVWNRRGYPAKASSSVLEGLVVHRALSAVIREAARTQRGGGRESGLAEAVRALGGFSAIIGSALADVIQECEANPRDRRHADDLRRRAQMRDPYIRRDVKVMLQRSEVRVHSSPRGLGGTRAAGRGPLGYGLHSEVMLRPPRLPWVGAADLVRLSPTGCRIADFKTGSPQQVHEFQVRAYAVLWALDDVLNPEGRPADELVIHYHDHNAEVEAPGAGGIAVLEEELRDRSDRAVGEISEHRPPRARPDPDSCRYCHVRHLCDDYWRSSALEARSVSPSRDLLFADFEIAATRQEQPLSWTGKLLAGLGLAVGTQVQLRLPHDAGCLPVVDGKGTVLGLVTTFDILLYLLQVGGDVSWQGSPPQAPALLL